MLTTRTDDKIEVTTIARVRVHDLIAGVDDDEMTNENVNDEYDATTLWFGVVVSKTRAYDGSIDVRIVRENGETETFYAMRDETIAWRLVDASGDPVRDEIDA